MLFVLNLQNMQCEPGMRYYRRVNHHHTNTKRTRNEGGKGDALLQALGHARMQGDTQGREFRGHNKVMPCNIYPCRHHCLLESPCFFCPQKEKERRTYGPCGVPRSGACFSRSALIVSSCQPWLWCLVANGCSLQPSAVETNFCHHAQSDWSRKDEREMCDTLKPQPSVQLPPLILSNHRPQRHFSISACLFCISSIISTSHLASHPTHTLFLSLTSSSS